MPNERVFNIIMHLVDGVCVLSIVAIAILSMTTLNHHPWWIRSVGLVGLLGCLFAVGLRLIRPTDKPPQQDEELSRCRQALPHGALAWFECTIAPWWVRHRDDFRASEGRRKTDAFFAVLTDRLTHRFSRLPHSLYQDAQDKNRDHSIVALVFAVTVLQAYQDQQHLLAKEAREDWKLAFGLLGMPTLLRSLSHEAYRLWDIPALLEGSRLRMNTDREAMLWGLLVDAIPGASALEKDNKKDTEHQTKTSASNDVASHGASSKPTSSKALVSESAVKEGLASSSSSHATNTNQDASVDADDAATGDVTPNDGEQAKEATSSDDHTMPAELKKFYTLLERCIDRRGINQNGWILSDGSEGCVWLTEKTLRDIGRKINQSPSDCLALLKAHDVLHQHGIWHAEDEQTCAVHNVKIAHILDSSPCVALSGRIEVSDAT